MRTIAEELEELELALAELRAAIAAPLREAAITVLAVLTTPRALLALVSLGLIVAGGVWLLVSMVDTWTT